MIKTLVKQTPVVRDVARWLMTLTAEHRRKNFRSGDYWESRYVRGQDSGCGSYNRLAEYKAEFLNRFVADHEIRSVIEFGSGDGAQLELADYPEYLGVDVSPTIVALTKSKFAHDARKRFVTLDAYNGETAELALSLDVVYHLVEDEVFEAHMRSLFDAATRYVIVYASNDERKSDSPHVRHRKFTDWVEANTEAKMNQHEPNRYPFDVSDLDNTSFADFFVFSIG